MYKPLCLPGVQQQQHAIATVNTEKPRQAQDQDATLRVGEGGEVGVRSGKNTAYYQVVKMSRLKLQIIHKLV